MMTNPWQRSARKGGTSRFAGIAALHAPCPHGQVEDHNNPANYPTAATRVWPKAFGLALGPISHRRTTPLL